jgi:repressor of nif and glnA expression
MDLAEKTTEDKMLAILSILHSARKPVGGTTIAQQLKNFGVFISDSQVRYHLRIMDERGLTRLVTIREGRTITEKGLSAMQNSLVGGAASQNTLPFKFPAAPPAKQA